MVSSQERICLGFLKNGENLRKVGGKEGFCSDRGQGGQNGTGWSPGSVQGVATARTDSSREGIHIGACRTALTRNNQVSLKGKVMCVACLGDDSDHRLQI